MHQAGFTNVVSPMGTALTEDQLRLLKRFTRRIVLALDADAAGEKATLRGLEVARQAMDHTDVLAFDARGLLRHEARLQADLRVTTLPPGMDPDEVVLRDPAEWGQPGRSRQADRDARHGYPGRRAPTWTTPRSRPKSPGRCCH